MYALKMDIVCSGNGSLIKQCLLISAKGRESRLSCALLAQLNYTAGLSILHIIFWQSLRWR